MQEIGNDTVPSFSGALWVCASCAHRVKEKINMGLKNIRDKWDSLPPRPCNSIVAYEIYTSKPTKILSVEALSQASSPLPLVALKSELAVALSITEVEYAWSWPIARKRASRPATGIVDNKHSQG